MPQQILHKLVMQSRHSVNMHVIQLHPSHQRSTLGRVLMSCSSRFRSLLVFGNDSTTSCPGHRSFRSFDRPAMFVANCYQRLSGHIYTYGAIGQVLKFLFWASSLQDLHCGPGRWRSRESEINIHHSMRRQLDRACCCDFVSSFFRIGYARYFASFSRRRLDL